MTYKLPESLRLELKKPLGKLVRGDPKHVMKVVRGYIKNSKLLVTVGDIVTENTIKHLYTPKLSIVDLRSLREPRTLNLDLTSYFNIWVNVENPPATLTDELIDAIRWSYTIKQKVLIIVEGEEDLATLPAALEAPIGSIVAYGQPGEGVVIVEVVEALKRKIINILERFERC